MATDILSRMESLNLVMQESAEVGQMDSIVYTPLFELMGELIDKLKAAISTEEVSA